MDKLSEQRLRKIIHDELLNEGFGTKVRVGNNIISIGTDSGQLRIHDKSGEKLVAQFTRSEVRQLNRYSLKKLVD